MRKTCAICGNKAGMKKLTLTDGYICSKCMVESGWGSYMTTPFGGFNWAKEHSVEDFKQFTKDGGDKKKAGEIWVKEHQKPIKKPETTEPPKININDGLADKEADKINSWDIDPKIKQELIDAKVSDLFGVKKEVRYLPNILEDDEPIKYACSGIVNGRTVLVVCTDERVIFLNKNMMIGMQQEEIPLEFVNAVTHSQGMALGSISVTNGANTTVIENVGRTSAPIMAKTIKEASQAVRNGVKSGDRSDSRLSMLKQLKELADSGVITQDEFEAKKKEILAKI